MNSNSKLEIYKNTFYKFIYRNLIKIISPSLFIRFSSSLHARLPIEMIYHNKIFIKFYQFRINTSFYKTIFIKTLLYI